MTLPTRTARERGDDRSRSGSTARHGCAWSPRRSESSVSPPGDEIDDARRAAVEEALPGLVPGSSSCGRWRCECSRSQRSRRSSVRATSRPRLRRRRSTEPPVRVHRRRRARRAARAWHAGARLRAAAGGAKAACARARRGGRREGARRGVRRGRRDRARPQGARRQAVGETRRAVALSHFSPGAGFSARLPGRPYRKAGERRRSRRTRYRFRSMPIPARYAVGEGLVAGAYPGTPEAVGRSRAPASGSSSI